ncbi:MAG TPA: hypothetical protein VND89_07165 [Acidimicrobiales bacterium]|nr:hypothetical protein [Acidimicrobiales bacterium]
MTELRVETVLWSSAACEHDVILSRVFAQSRALSERIVRLASKNNESLVS